MPKNSRKQSANSGKSKRPKVLPWTSRRDAPGVVMKMPRLRKGK